MELVSVVTPAYNAARTLRRAYDSVASQLHTAWEYIVIDDGSTDGTRAILEEFVSGGRTATLSTPNRGQGAALNTGIGIARGEFIAFLDADDEYQPDHLSSRLGEFRARPDLDLLWGGMEVIAADYQDTLVPDVEAGHGLIPVTECVVQGTLFGRRRIFEQLPFNEDRGVWYQDYDLVKRARAHGKVDRFALPTYRYYRDSGQSLVDRVKGGWQARSPVHSEA